MMAQDVHTSSEHTALHSITCCIHWVFIILWAHEEDAVVTNLEMLLQLEKE